MEPGRDPGAGRPSIGAAPMQLSDDDARARLQAHDHGVLSTRHDSRGVDAVPVVFAVDRDGFVGVPIDRVKPKSPGPLQRERNLEADPRASLLIEHWDADDWSALWWVRAALRWSPDEAGRSADLADLLATRHTQYRNRPFERILVFRVMGIIGWSASA